MTSDNVQAVWRGDYVTMKVDGRWEYVTRTRAVSAVGIVPVTDAGELVLVEQFRPPVSANVVELPAGLVGDIDGLEDEDLRSAAARELLEETGYQAASLTKLFCGASTPGLADEVVTFFLAEGLTKVAAGGGDDSEEIEVHLVPLGGVHAWLTNRQRAGLMVDVKIYAGLHFLGNRVG